MEDTPDRITETSQSGYRSPIEEDLVASTSLVNSIIFQSPYPMWVSDHHGTLIKINQACMRLLNITEDEVVRKYNVLEDNIVRNQGLMPLVEKVFEQGETVRFDLKYDTSRLDCLVLNNRSSVILDVTMSPIKDDNGRITHVVIQHIDITDRKRTEEALRLANVELENRVRERTADLSAANAALKREINERLLAQSDLNVSEERYRLLFDQMFNGFALHEILCDEKGKPVDYRFLAVNPAFERITGLRKEEIIGKTLHEILPEEEDSWIKTYGEVALTGEPRNFRAFSRSLDRHFEISVFSPVQGEFAVVFNDMTERAWMEQTIQEREQQFRTLCESAPIGIYMTDHKGRTIYTNCRWAKISGLKFDDSLDMGWEHALHPADRENAEGAWNAAVASHSPFCLEYRIVTPEGRLVWARSLANPILDQEGKLTGYVGTVEDITAVRQAREDLLKTQKLESIGVLAEGIAHDFNNTMAAVLGYISLARSRFHAPGEAVGFLESSERAILRAKGLTQQLLSFAQGREPVKKMIHLNELLKELTEFACGEANVTCHFMLMPDLWTVAADLGQLGQVIHNLVVNAVQAMTDGGTVTVQSKNVAEGGERKSLVTFSVSDTGAGIADAHRDRIFDPYFTTKKGGSGLGLATCYSIVKRHGGFISVDTIQGAGTTFTVHLPALLPTLSAAKNI